jgi:hypothetical protein
MRRTVRDARRFKVPLADWCGPRMVRNILKGNKTGYGQPQAGNMQIDIEKKGNRLSLFHAQPVTEQHSNALEK